MIINLLEKSSEQTIDTLMADKGVTMNHTAFSDTMDKAVFAANALGIIQGVGDGRFDPNGTLTRSQIAAILNRVANVLGVSTDGYSHGFTDVTGHWVDSELGWPVSAGIINGVGGDRFDPEGQLTTEQVIIITWRMLVADKNIPHPAIVDSPIPPISATVDGDEGFVEGVTYELVLKPYAESLGYTCVYYTEIVNGNTKFWMEFTKGNNRVCVDAISDITLTELKLEWPYVVMCGTIDWVQMLKTSYVTSAPGLYYENSTEFIKGKLLELS